MIFVSLIIFTVLSIEETLYSLSWIKGSNEISTGINNGVFGDIDVYNSDNTISGRRFGYSVDISKNEILYFGGRYFFNETYYVYNDVFIFNTQNENWKWVKGSKIPDQGYTLEDEFGYNDFNLISSRGLLCGVKITDEELFFFGGYGVDSSGYDWWKGLLGDGWFYDFVNKRFKHTIGSLDKDQPGNYSTSYHPNNVPGSREFHSCVGINSEELVVFGGTGYDYNSKYGLLNDFFVYSHVQNEFKWIHGDIEGGKNGSYGVKGEYGPQVVPGARSRHSLIRIDKERLMLFGGRGLDFDSREGSLNDVFIYNITKNQFQWVHGSKNRDDTGEYSDVYNSDNRPCGRGSSILLLLHDPDEVLLVSGGSGMNDQDLYNDFFIYSIKRNQFKWILGDMSSVSTKNQGGIYGVKGESDSNNKIGSRNGAYGITLYNGFVLIVGGKGYDVNGSIGYLQDVWVLRTVCPQGYYGIDCSITKCFSYFSNDTNVCSSNGNCDVIGCVCDTNYYGIDCNISKCFDIFSNESSVCFGHGNCVHDKCECSVEYTGVACDVFQPKNNDPNNDLVISIVVPIVVVFFLFFVILFICVVVFVLGYLYKSKKLQKFKNIDEIDLILVFISFI